MALTSLNPDGQTALEQYLSVVGPLMQSAGANLVCRYELRDGIAGENEVQFVSIIEYPDEAAVKLVFESDVYKSLAQAKKLAFTKYQVSSVAVQ